SKTNSPQGWAPVSVLEDHTLRDPDPVVTLARGDRVNLLVLAPPAQAPQFRPHKGGDQTGPFHRAPAPPPNDQP
ncbi:MAG TPA: hypothetical protein VMF65_20465, partial [Acidimicrobiales bacterium]|nr:hypothetical protein [Acidimicrobiales bacterium]